MGKEQTGKFIMPANPPSVQDWVPDSATSVCMVCQIEQFSMVRFYFSIESWVIQLGCFKLKEGRIFKNFSFNLFIEDDFGILSPFFKGKEHSSNNHFGQSNVD